MPFTFSHPALIIPLKYLPAKYISITGLVIGSIVPDFEKFIKLSGGNIYSHTLLGILWFNLPLGLALAFIFHLVVRNILINHLPVFFRERLARFKSFNWSRHFRDNPGAVALCIIVGALSHLLLDSFTHHESSYIYLVPFLLKNIDFGPFVFLEQITLMWVVLVSFTFSVVGLLYIMYIFIKLPAEPVEKRSTGSILKFWMLVLMIALTVIAIKFMVGGVVVSKWQLIYIGIGAGLMGVFFTSALWLKAKFT